MAILRKKYSSKSIKEIFDSQLQMQHFEEERSGFSFTTFTIYRTAGEGEAISLTPLYHFHPLRRHLEISRAINAESSPLNIVSSRVRTRNLWFPSASYYKCWVHILRNIYIFRKYGFRLD